MKNNSFRVLFALSIAFATLSACGGGGSSSSTNNPTIFQMMPGTWNVTKSEPYTSCRSLDLTSYIVPDQWIMNTREAGTLKYFDIMSIDGSSQVEYQVTQNGDPLNGVRNYNNTSSSGSCVWNNKKTYELTKISASQLDGTLKTEITANHSNCEQCNYQWKVSLVKISDNVTPAPSTSTSPSDGSPTSGGTSTSGGSSTPGATPTSGGSTVICSSCASSGACSGHGGVNCSAGPDSDGSIICNDGWRGSSVQYHCG